MGISITDILEKLDYTPENGLVDCNKLNYKHIAEWLHITERTKKLGVDLKKTKVLFRRFLNDEGIIINSKPSVYIFTDETFFTDNKKATELHAKLWSAGEIEAYIIVGKTQIDIINARRPAEVRKKDLILENLVLASKSLDEFNDQRFSAHIFGKGMFWEQEDFGNTEKKQDKRFYANRLREENTPFHQLLDYLLATRKTIEIVNQETTDKLIIICVLIKFLEGIQDYDGKHTLNDIYKDLKVNNLEEALEKGLDCFFSILDNLAKEFNGQIFTILNEDRTKILKSSTIGLLAQFLRAELNIKTKQFFIWKQYNFNYLPIELVSSIYENFLPKQKGVVYTPPFLVNFLIDEIMPLDKPSLSKNNEFKILDPSCGSGAFLVAAYKRLLDWWTIQHSTKENLHFPNKEVCQVLLEKNVFGVDIEPTATLITIFSLTTTLLNKLTPKEIWNGLKFNDLRENIQTENFFEWASTASKDFDLVIGNPPFNFQEGKKLNDYIHTKGDDGKIIDFTDENHINFIHKKLPNNNFALYFFEGAMSLGKKTCLIIPSNVLLYNKKAQNYRKDIFTHFTVHKIFDFTHLRRILFGSADTPVCAIISENKKSEQKPIEHTIIHRIETTEKKIAFQIDHYDRHFVRWDWAIDEAKQFIWKTNLLGGGSLFHLIYRLSLLETLLDFINLKGWSEVRGFEGGNNIKIENIDRIIAIDDNGLPIINKNVSISTNNLKNPFMYEPPFIIFDQVIGIRQIPICLVKKNNEFTTKKILYYNRDFIGISAKEQDEQKLIYIFQSISSPKKGNLNFQSYLYATSSSALVLTESDVNKSEILNIPFPENEEYLQLSETEQIIQDDVLNYYRHLGKSIKKIKAKDKKQGETEERKGAKLFEKTTQAQLKNFGKIFCDIINPMHSENEMFWQIGDVFQTQNGEFIAYQFIYGEKIDKTFEIKTTRWAELDKIFNKMIFNTEENQAGVFTRLVRIYGNTETHDSLLLIKPSALRYWLGSIALRDADTTISDYFKAGY